MELFIIIIIPNGIKLFIIIINHYKKVRTEIINTSVIKVTFHRAKILRLILQALYGHRNDSYVN
jgi:hypothetical protein